MHFEANKTFWSLALLVLCCVSQWREAECYRTEVEITPAPIEEPTTKKSGFFSGIKSFFGGATTTTTLRPEPDATTPKSIPAALPAAPASSASGQKPPPLVIPHAPLMPLGPRPDTPPSSPVAGHAQQPPQWPQAQTSSTTTTERSAQPFPASTHGGQGAATTAFGSGQQRPSVGQPQPSAGQPQPNLPPGFAPYRPPKGQPSGLDLSYGGGGRPQGNSHPGFGLAPLTSSTTTTTSRSVTPPQSPLNFDLRMGGDAGTTSTVRSPQPGKEDFPPLPAPRSPTPTPSSPLRPPSPSAAQPASPIVWRSTTPASPSAWHSSTPATVLRPGSPVQPRGPGAASTTTDRAIVPSAAGGNSVATDDEIRQLTESLYTKEVNNQLNLIRVNPQGRTRSIDSTDEAPQPLLEVDARAFESPTIAKMRVLFNNYELDTQVNEHVTPNERKEENDFLDAIMATSVMRQAMLFLQNKGIVSPDPKTHRDLVRELWFTQYSRGKGKIGSSGFEHVFVNEVKEGTIIGLHNWVYFYDEEKAGRLDYKGYLKQQDIGTKGKILKTRFTHNGLNKPVNTLFVGTSPELELALYTVCFQLRPDRTCSVSLGNSKFGIVTYSWRYRGKSLIGSAYPEI